MSTERNELADAVKLYLDDQGYEYDMDHPDTSTRMSADIAAVACVVGYRKPQQVTTTPELEALPIDSVVKDRVGDIYERVESNELETPVWRVPGIRGPLVTASILLPATVLHVGGAE